MRRSLPRVAISAGIVSALLIVCSRLPHIDHATVPPLLILAILGLAKKWGWAEALTGAIVGGIGYDYYFLPPLGFGVATAEGWIAFAAFLVTALVTGQLAAQSKRRRIRTTQQHEETDTLYQLVNSLLESGSAESTVSQLADKLVETLGATSVALYDKRGGKTFWSGVGQDVISDQALHETAASGRQVQEADSKLSLVPIREGSEIVGSLGIRGATVSDELLNGIAARVGLGLARRYWLEKTTEAEVVRRTEELKSAVLDAMAHEVRNPLNSIKIAVTTLLSKHSGSESLRHEMLTIVEAEVDRMDQFLDEAVQIARVDAHELLIKRQPQDITPLIPAVAAELRGLAGRRSIRVSVPEALPLVECDKDMIMRVLKQLLSNALKYSPEDSPLDLSAELTAGKLVIDVVDRGPGVDADERNRIFEPYYRGRAARSGRPGTGLGLASARSIMRAHGGEIWVTSPPEGGSAFHVSLPVTGIANRVGTV